MVDMVTFIERLLNPIDNINHVAWHYARAIDLKVTQRSLRRAVDGHPDYPSLLALNDAFMSFGAETVAIRLNKVQLAGLDQPYVTQITLSDKGTQAFTVASPESARRLLYLHPERNQWITTTVDEFADMSSGVVLVAAADEYAGETDYQKKRRAERTVSAQQTITFAIIPTIVLMTITLGLLKNGVEAILPSCFLVLASIGSVLGLLLLCYEVDQHNPVLKQVCSGKKSANCGAVLSSSVSKILGISWSLIGFTYFAGTVIALLTAGFEHLPLLQLLSLLGLPALCCAFFSLYYQWQIVKQWCMLCLLVQGVLILQGCVILTAGWPFLTADEFSYQEAVTLLVSFVLPFIGAGFGVSALQQSKKGKKNENELLRLKRNPQIFRALLEKQKAVTMSTEGLGIAFGNPNAKHQIIKVCNPYCGPCAKAHQAIEDISHNNNDVQIRIIFTASDDEKDSKAPPVKHLMAVSERCDEKILKQALNDWYSAPKKDYAAFAAKYPMNGELQIQSEKLVAMRTWCDQMEISFTPTFFVNGHQLPDIYTVDDLKYFLKT